MNTIIIGFCPTCGQPHKYLATCKTCGATAIRGTMDEMTARQAAYAATKPVAPVPATTEAPIDYLSQTRAAMAAVRRASLAKPAHAIRAPWHRPCTCGHCMTCIGE